MEVWWAGFRLHPWRLLIYIPATFVLLLGYNRFAGLRRDASWLEVVIDSVEELGLGLLLAAAILSLLGRIHFGMTPDEIVGKIVVEAMTVAIGVSVGTAQLGGGDEKEPDTGMAGDGQEKGAHGASDARQQIRLGDQMVIGLCGAILFAANIAPTEEIIVIGTEVSSWGVLGMALVSLALAALILYYSEFRGSRRFVHTDGLSAVLFGTVITYALALGASAAILWFFGRFDGLAPITCLAETVTLGVAATLGASAGRLLLQ
jgi:putative integral membrane protein (TIGR02587 family)